MPARVIIFPHFFSAVNPVPLGAGIKFTVMLPHFPVTLKGMECGVLQPHAHDPHALLILIKFNFAFLIAFSRAGTVSFALPYPTPIYPFLFPTTANAAKVMVFPSDVFFCVCFQMLPFPP